MSENSMSRRDFSQLMAAAFGGLLAGSYLSGCSTSGQSGSEEAGEGAQGDMHACRGLNGCEGQGAGGNNACAGQGGCASAAMHHECMGHNACKGQGGGEHAGENACRGQGGCAVPIDNDAGWQAARERFEQQMQTEGVSVGAAPAA